MYEEFIHTSLSVVAEVFSMRFDFLPGSPNNLRSYDSCFVLSRLENF